MANGLIIRWWIGATVFFFGSIMGIIIIIIHCKKVHSNLKSNTSANTKPLSLPFKLLNCSMILSLIMYTLSMIIIFTFTWKPFMSTTFCRINVFGAFTSYIFSKMFMYLTLIIRLYVLYNNPIFQYNTKSIKISAILTIMSGLSIATLIILTSDPYPIYYNLNLGRCVSDVKPYLILCLALYDIVLSIGSMIAFINPLKKMVKSMLNDKGFTEHHRCKIDELIQIGMKYAILTSIASLTTIIFVILVGLELSIIAPFDYVTNMMCMLLMTPYYEDIMLYERLCCGAIKCGNWCIGCCCGYVDDDNNKNLKIVVTPPQDTEATGNTTTSATSNDENAGLTEDNIDKSEISSVNETISSPNV